MATTSSHLNNNNNNFPPVIGVLCIDIAVNLQKLFGNDYCSYIAASYVKYLESVGAHVIPIYILLPGGAVFFDKKYCTDDLRNDCVQSSKYIYDIAKDLSEKGQHFPLWGTCMGFQLLLTHSADLVEIRQHCQKMLCSLPVKLESDEVLATSKLFADIDNDLKLKMANKPFGIHFHQYCITKDDLHINKIDKQWKVLATNEDPNGLEFITIVEHNSLPFYGVQIHPERVIFENYITNDDIHHCLECFELTQYFAKFFVKQCLLNGNCFTNQLEESRHSIHNFPIDLNTTAEKKIFRQYYLFKNDVDYPQVLKNKISK